VRTGGQLIRQRPAGASPIVVSPSGVPCKDFSVSPDGTLVAMVYDQQPESVVVVPSNGGPPRVIYTALPNEPLAFTAISPDNQWVAFSKAATGSDLIVVSTAPPHLPVLVTPGRPMVSALGPSRWSFSPDSRFIAVVGELTTAGRSELRVFDLSSRLSTVLLSASQAAMGGGAKEVGWSDSGTILVRATLSTGGAAPINQILTCERTGPCSPLPGDPGNGITSVGGMAVAPDGTFLVYLGNQRTGYSDLYRISSRGGLSTRILQNPTTTGRVSPSSLVVSRDGQRVAFLADFASASSFFDAYVMPASGATVLQPVVVATGNQSIESLVFSPTSNAVAFRFRAGSSGTYGAYQANLTTPAQSPVLLQVAPVSEIEWSR
jgi:Tol biopolymer transport system component